MVDVATIECVFGFCFNGLAALSLVFNLPLLGFKILNGPEAAERRH